MDNHQPPPPPSSSSSASASAAGVPEASAGGNSSRDQYLKSLNKLSHKISKPTIPKKPFDQPPNNNSSSNKNNFNPPLPPPPPPPSQQQQQPPVPAGASTQPQGQSQSQSQNQPPVYNINKSDFRDVVQKLTGSPAHERFSTPPPIHAPKPQSSRLQRIRPPPLANVSNRPPPLLNNPSAASGSSAVPPLPQPFNPGQGFIHRPPAPLSPLPPFPAVHAAAESPVSAYMRYLHNSGPNFDPNNKQFSGFLPLAPLVSPRWNSNFGLPPPQQQQGVLPSPTSQPQFQLPLSPLPFGCLNSPKSSYPLHSPTSFPLSPTVPVPSPRWRGL